MKMFIKKTLCFALLLSILICIFKTGLSAIENGNAVFLLEGSPETVIIGHSHSECAFNDSLIPGVKNLSDSGESYFYSYFKLMQILDQNSNIKTVLIEFTNNQIESEMNEWIWGQKYMDYRYSLYSSFMNLDDELTLLLNNPRGYLNALSVALREKLVRVTERHFNYKNRIGGYLRLDRNKTAELVKAARGRKIEHRKNMEISNVHLQYLEKIIEHCRKLNVRPVLVRSPLHELYAGYANEPVFQKIRNNRFADVDFLDFSKFPLADSGFGDFTHLNYKGAEVFSVWFAKLLEEGLLEKTGKICFELKQ